MKLAWNVHTAYNLACSRYENERRGLRRDEEKARKIKKERKRKKKKKG